MQAHPLGGRGGLQCRQMAIWLQQLCMPQAYRALSHFLRLRGMKPIAVASGVSILVRSGNCGRSSLKMGKMPTIFHPLVSYVPIKDANGIFNGDNLSKGVNNIARNLKYQFLTAINQHFKEGMDKHSMKHAAEMNGTRIFSYADRSNLVDLAAGFSEYMKQAHPQIKEVRHITTDHVQGFLAAKSSTATQATLSQYGSRFAKLERLVNDSYKSCKVDFHSVVVPISSKCSGKVRTQMLSASDYQTLLSSTTNTNLRNALVLSYCAGLRASECSKIKASDWHAASGVLRIVDSKGKRTREVLVPQQHHTAVDAVMSSSQDRICSCQTESLQKAFRRQLAACGLASTYTAGAFHMTRKAYATNLYRECRAQGMGVQSSLSTVSRSLGHGANRNDLMKQYICCPID